MVGTMHRLKNKLRSSRSHKKNGTWALDEDSLHLKNARDGAEYFNRDTVLADTINVTDDVEDIFYGRSSALPHYRVSEQIHATSTQSTQEDSESLPANRRSVSQLSATTSSNNGPGSVSSGSSATLWTTRADNEGELERLRAEVKDVRDEVKAIRREVMNELHMTRYDVLKEIMLLKSAFTRMAEGLTLSMPSTASTPTDRLSAEDQAALARQPPTKMSPGTRQRIAASRTNVYQTPTPAARTSVRLTQLSPVSDKVLSAPLSPQQLDEMFPLLDFTTELAAYARELTPGTRTWALSRVQEWLDDRFNLGNDTLLAVVGDGGTGKSVFCGSVAQIFRENLLAVHCCHFNYKWRSSPRSVLLSLVRQLVDNLPAFKNQLARLNLKYVLEETDPFLLAGKVLVEPLNAMEEPIHSTFMLVDGIDQCVARVNDHNELMDFFDKVIPLLPSWVGFLISSKPSSKLAKGLPVSSVLDFSAKNDAFVADVSSLIDTIAQNFDDNDAAEVKKMLKLKSGGNFTYLKFTKQALSHPGMAVASKGVVPMEVVHDLPESLYDIYAEIFEDKFGQGRARVWAKAKPLLQLVIGATAGPYSPVTEEQAKKYLNLTDDDLRILRRSFVDIVSLRHGAYRIESSALCTWLCDVARADEHFYYNIDDAVIALRKMRSSGSGTGSSRLSKDKSNHNDKTTRASNRGTRSPNRQHIRHEPRTSHDFKPVGILKHGKM